MKSKIIEIPLYNCYLKVIDTNNLKEIQKDEYIGEYFKEDTELYARTLKYFATVKRRKNRQCLYIVLNSKGTTKLNAGIIAHEALHCVNMLFEDRGVVSDRDNDKADAYLLAWIVNQVHKFVKL